MSTAIALPSLSGVLEIQHPDLQFVEILEGPQSALGFVHGLSETTWLASVEFAARAIDKLQFVLGDLMLRGEQAFGDKAYLKAGVVAGHNPETLRHYAWVAKRVPVHVRNPHLSFNHHRQVATLETSDQRAWLARAEAETLSVSALRVLIKAARHTEAEPKPSEVFASGPIHQIIINLCEENYCAFCELARAEGCTAGAMLEKLALDALHVQRRG